MIPCPLCEHGNIEGADLCEQCGQPLDDTHLKSPRTTVELGLLAETIASLAPRSPITVTPQTPVHDVLHLLVQHQIGCVFVVEDERPVGVFSERDALLRLNTRAEEFDARPIADFMTPGPKSLQQDTRLVFAVHQMELGGYRHLPIVDAEGRLRGVVSVRDILRYLTEKFVRSGRVTG